MMQNVAVVLPDQVVGPQGSAMSMQMDGQMGGHDGHK